MKRFFILLAIVLTTVGCAATPRINSDFDPAVDFSRLRTYSWASTAVPAGMDPLLHQRIRDSIDRSLRAKRFDQASPGDFAITFTVGARDRVEVRDLGPYGRFYRDPWRWGRVREVEIRNNREGTLAIDIFDTQTQRPIWRGTATQDISRSRIDQPQIDAAVGAVLARFPPPSR